MNIEKYIAEFIGTAIFLTIILKSGGDKYVIVLGLLAAILFMSDISGGHVNPAISFMEYCRGNLNKADCAGYIIAQLLGALLAIKIASFKGK